MEHTWTLNMSCMLAALYSGKPFCYTNLLWFLCFLQLVFFCNSAIERELVPYPRLGGENLAVAGNTYVVSWFAGKEINTVFGINLSFSRIVSVSCINSKSYAWSAFRIQPITLDPRAKVFGFIPFDILFVIYCREVQLGWMWWVQSMTLCQSPIKITNHIWWEYC